MSDASEWEACVCGHARRDHGLRGTSSAGDPVRLCALCVCTAFRSYPTVPASGADVPGMKILRPGETIDVTLQASDGYDKLRDVLRRAVEQASAGKGKERHACGEPFHEQKIVKLTEWTGGTGFAVGQACKKALESTRLPRDRAVAELLGAINYLAAAVIVLEEKDA